MSYSLILFKRIEPKFLYEPNTGCWLWLGDRNRNGYGLQSHGGFKEVTHKTSWEAHRGPVPRGHVLDHLCRNRLCGNPEHLEPVSISENTLRGNEARRRGAPSGGK